VAYFKAARAEHMR